MERIYTDVRKYGNKILHRGYDETGEQFFEKSYYKPRLWIPSNSPTKWKSFYTGQYLAPIQYDSIREAFEALESMKDISNFQLYGTKRFEYQFISERYPNDVSPDFSKIRTLNFDIEVGTDDANTGFPDVETADQTITSITAEYNDQYYVWGFYEYENESDDVHYFQCNHENQLLNAFLSFWRKLAPDVVTGWNVLSFDIPYLYNRMCYVLGEEKAKELSPWNIAKPTSIYVKGKMNPTIDLFGIQVLDYMVIYQVFSMKKRESYRLDFISHVELGTGKVNYDEFESIFELYSNDYKKFLDYNIQDVALVRRLEDKLGMMHLAMTIAYIMHVNYMDTMKQVRMWDAYTFHRMTKEGMVPPLGKTSHKEYKYEGAYVKEPVIGKHGWVLSVDISSLYPSIFLFLNISPETLRGVEINDRNVDNYLQKKVTIESDHAIAANGTAYDKSFEGLFPRIIRDLYKRRKEHKKRKIDAEKELQNVTDESKKKHLERESSINGVTEKALKITLNSLYGAVGSEYFPFYETKMAEAITVTGQLINRWIEESISEYLNSILETDDVDYCIAGDTDSSYIALDTLVEKFLPGETDKNRIANFIDQFAEKKLNDVIESAVKRLAEYLNAYDHNAIAADREAIADSAIWVAKKRYALNVLDMEGVRYKEPKMKLMGLETAKSSTPEIVRQFMEKVIYSVLNNNERETQKMIKKFRQEFNELPVEEIAFPRTLNGMKKYRDTKTIYGPKTPIHVRAALLYNHVIKKESLENKYQYLQDFDKVKFVYMKQPNPIYNENIFGFTHNFPRETGLHEYVDYKTMFNKTFEEPLRPIFENVGWSMKKTNKIDNFFE